MELACLVLQIALAYAAGLLTLINPCILPLLPMMAAGALSRHPAAPLAMVSGLVTSFTIAGMGAYALTRALGLVPSDIALAANVLMIGAGLFLLLPVAQTRFAGMTGDAAGAGVRMMAGFEGNGILGEALAGGLLGLAWSPCIGPTLGAAIGLAAGGENLFEAFVVMLSFSLGAGTIMLLLAYGGRALIQQRKLGFQRLLPYARPVLALALVTIGIAGLFHLDRVIEAWALGAVPAPILDFSVSI